MGYYTCFNLSVTEGNEDLIVQFRQESQGAEWAIDEEGKSNDSAKWYEYEEELQEFSAKHPDVLFTLYGEGEESGDLWIRYFKNGKVQLCPAKITYDPFNESLLK